MLCVCVCSQRLYHVKKERDSDQSHNNIQHMLSPMKTGNENRTDWERHRFLTTLGHKAVLYGLIGLMLLLGFIYFFASTFFLSLLGGLMLYCTKCVSN